ncbi:MAG: undecaprenyl-diphosphate phosphatase [Planctomycetes bacterium]|nr:undecaprenyl-diphosphate phosphatase [Planctomycetota bacterium]
MTIFESISLAVIQGLTEFLPVSSSGHLVILEEIFFKDSDAISAAEDNVAFIVLLHFASLLAVLIVFRKTILGLLYPKLQTTTIAYVILATIPAAVVGLAFKDRIEGLFKLPLPVGIALIVTGAVLLSTKFAKPAAVRTENMGFARALVIGIAQAIAIMPGISRSGSTIATGMLLKVDRDDAAAFSFLLAIPTIGGAMILKARKLGELASADMMPVVVGFTACLVVSLIALKLLLLLVKKKRFDIFAYYCIPVGIAVVIYELSR